MKEITTMIKDPVCGKSVDESSTVRVEEKGKKIYFCGEKCRDIYLGANPGAKQRKKNAGIS